MMWWFLILACGAGAVVWAGIAAYLRVRRHISDSAAAAKKSGMERGPDSQ
jgi:putative exporter of polyketide antibiotics